MSGPSLCTSWLRAAGRRRRRHLQLQRIAGGLNSRLIHRLHACRADLERAWIDHPDHVEDLLAASKVVGEEGGVIVVVFAAGKPVVPAAGTLIERVNCLPMH